MTGQDAGEREFTLPAGPYAAHLMAAHALMRHLAAMTSSPVSAAPAVEAHANHIWEVARWTATGHEMPPQPTVNVDTGEAPDGWDRVIIRDDGLVLAGWHYGRFVAYAPTEQIVEVCVTTLLHVYEQTHSQTSQETP